MSALDIPKEIEELKSQINTLDEEIKEAEREGNETKATRKSAEKTALINERAQWVVLLGQDNKGEMIIFVLSISF